MVLIFSEPCFDGLPTAAFEARRGAAVADRLPDRLAGPGGALAERPGVRSPLPLATAR